MKKVFAIIAIMVVLVGAVFADTTTEHHKITITTVIPENTPAFQLYYSTDVATNGSATDFSAKAVSDPYSADLDLSGNTATYNIATAKMNFNFVAKLLGGAKLGSTTVYTLRFVAEPLASEHTHKVGSATTATTYYINPSYANCSITANSTDLPSGITMGVNIAAGAMSAVGGTGTGLDSPANVSGTITATFNTTNIVAGNLATFAVEYPQTEAAPADTYTADIWMVVSTS